MNILRKAVAAPFKLIHFTLSIAVLSVLLGLGIAGLSIMALGALVLVIFGVVGLLVWLGIALVLGLITKGSLRVAQAADPEYAVTQRDRVEELRSKVAGFKPQAVH